LVKLVLFIHLVDQHTIDARYVKNHSIISRVFKVVKFKTVEQYNKSTICESTKNHKTILIHTIHNYKESNNFNWKYRNAARCNYLLVLLHASESSIYKIIDLPYWTVAHFYEKLFQFPFKKAFVCNLFM